MKPRFLLPHSFKKVGWLLLIPSVVFGVFVQHFDFYIEGFELAVGTEPIFRKAEAKNNMTNELAGALILISGFFVAFSKERIEDELVSRIRLESLQWSVYLNYALLLGGILFVYGQDFIYVMIYNMYTILIFFIIRFHFILYVKDKLVSKTEPA